MQQTAAQFYDRFVESIKQRIRTAQVKAALAADVQLVLHYWEIGRDILASQEREGWGATPIGIPEYRLLPPKLKAELLETKQLNKLVVETGERD